jgi:two-component system nitrogen regulation response regulator GlnG
MASLLLIDDDTALVPTQVRHAFPAPGHDVIVAGTGRDGIAAMRAARPAVVLLDVMLPDGSGLEVYQELRAIDPGVPVVFITTSSTSETAIEAMKRGAYEYLMKPLDVDQLRRIVHGALEISRFREPVALAEAVDTQPEGALLGTSSAMLDIYKAIGRVAPQSVPVLVTGESGTGKELVARAIYQHSARASGPFLALNCAAIPESLLESELFGHERGAFTGADRRRIGKFEQCNGGTLLLDEVGEMALPLQAKLLRLLQEQRFERVGGNETVQTDVRIIAATNRDLRALSADNQFRADLYYRLGVFTIHLPALRERRDDIPLLVHHYLRQFGQQMDRDIREVTADAMVRLVGYTWPGNIRELQSVVRQALLNASTSNVLHAMFLPDLTARPLAAAGSFDIERFIRDRIDTAAGDAYAEAHREVDRILMTVALERTGGNQRDAAKLLGISRQTMRMRQRSLGIHVAHTVETDDDAD